MRLLHIHYSGSEGVERWESTTGSVKGTNWGGVNIRSQNVRLMLQALDERAVPDATVISPPPDPMMVMAGANSPTPITLQPDQFVDAYQANGVTYSLTMTADNTLWLITTPDAGGAQTAYYFDQQNAGSPVVQLAGNPTGNTGTRVIPNRDGDVRVPPAGGFIYAPDGSSWVPLIPGGLAGVGPGQNAVIGPDGRLYVGPPFIVPNPVPVPPVRPAPLPAPAPAPVTPQLRPPRQRRQALLQRRRPRQHRCRGVRHHRLCKFIMEP